ncbi:NAD(P)-dependent glycerol-3-phosphate dehydrogenase [Leptospira levettii]|uniref:Glycerol-3-phosphate dehydrogenase [NAD(P)+] n=2 Tax=Leptospira TaxID=171 RepID=A0A2N0AXG1_9LEPT|nr:MULTISPECIES: NAD(P)H-dependent glycerol-3-phosphate dehydrogenase [Leptospira]MCG6147597.1 NAD(P)-dependent glycerol-3-phosphate dehydrogenase [Leptospira levettii]MCW7465120.1 NAD(P)-dependent glycerol-3-phosphate dehydrogenase [Leptospira levettii]MCW7473954.1 NAD(P)-dependent glycerol-3-phosphate dehydrogenase [Leptospira levettii]MCW7495960.1 NAD(P)-dependent glycerol-3-phosphate dehydrogenase [Leptospira levettii]MCW7507664.1 NAD(P)-dependent glycerol-3-phosphate dehydrogenase [Leptos
MKIGIIGAGSFGTALGSILADKGYDVTLWTRSEEQARSINENHMNSKHMPDLVLPEKLRASTDLIQVVKDKEMIVSAPPSHALSGILKEIKDHIPHKVPIVSASKGIENESLRLVSEIFESELPGQYHSQLSYLSGPSFAKEMVKRVPTIVSIASKNEATAKRVQEIFSFTYFRTYWTPDVVGVEVGGALKNVIAIAAGVADGLGFGQNTRAALITRGLNEITRMGIKMGADPMTFLGPSGMGDLVLTCCGEASRNRTVGFRLGKGEKLKEILASMNEVAEGVKTTLSTKNLSDKLGVEMAITQEVYRMLYEDKDPKEVVKALMGRDLKREGV